METPKMNLQKAIEVIVDTAKDYVKSSYQAKAHAYHRLRNSVENLEGVTREQINDASFRIQRKMKF